jgi:membrane fusion protein, multidrug efflux system
MTAEATAVPVSKPSSRRWLMVVLPLAIALAGGYFWLSGGRYEATDNAALHQARISVASDLSGRVVSVSIRDNGRVKAGDILFQVDPEPYRLALAQADAALAQARLGVSQMRAALAIARGQERIAQDEVTFETSEFARARSLTGKGVATDSALDKARYASTRANEALQSAHEGVLAALAALGGDPEIEINSHPTVLAAQAARDKAAYNLELTKVRAMSGGVIYQAASFKPGQFVTAGASLFALVDTDDVWIDANFKETQLTGIAPGQTAEISFDQRPGVTLSATVEAIGAGTGAEFSILPAQNATGNWVKVTQRIPVRLRLEQPTQAAGLESGVSASVTVDTGQRTMLGSLLSGIGF